MWRRRTWVEILHRLCQHHRLFPHSSFFELSLARLSLPINMHGGFGRSICHQRLRYLRLSLSVKGGLIKPSLLKHILSLFKLCRFRPSLNAKPALIFALPRIILRVLPNFRMKKARITFFSSAYFQSLSVGMVGW